MVDASAFEQVLRLAVGALSVVVFVVGALAYVRRPTRRMLWVLALFTVFLLQGILLLLEVLVQDSPAAQSAYFAFQFVEVLLVTAVLLQR